MQPLTAAGFQQYVRIALYMIFAMLAKQGYSVPDSTTALIAGIVGILATLAWTVYGTRLNALIAAVAASPDVKKIIVADPAQASAVPSPKVVSGNAP